ncbi:CMP-N,N'-diacetyllegionaminic acid synthase [Emticicia aquatica]|jgi:N-acylneuraminate cytidylyltransferase|uniref:CMP-N,N'-diacetyllegionaminic acid synthase n=1 Tax=Emticicia aquatica TaxID=1681835 RepID=A0ABM9AKT2_9BACT|nr:pseudaminic acid cytidylyltransferase [Emticicia aquatica]CAH0994323.1 CMP-N,N'-diacetyllegionaminic acid synthase [Emticicia aquatica]
MNLAIIPARGGSKRIPRKNIKDFLGKPIIAYSIEAAIESGLFDEVMVSTDDEEIAKIAQIYGAKVPFKRSSENANDFATTVDVLVEVLDNYKNLNRTFETACCIYPTAPFVSSELLQKSFQKLNNENFDSVYPVQKFSFPPQRSVVFENDKLRWQNAENAQVRSQDLTPLYHDAGQFYFFKTEKLLKNRSILTNNTGGIIISEMDAHDIDNEEDWQVAAFKYSLKSK